jgi:hypothetical protein
VIAKILAKFGYVHMSDLPYRELTISYRAPTNWRTTPHPTCSMRATLRDGTEVHGDLYPA